MRRYSILLSTAAAIPLFTPPALADPSLFYVDPPTPEYFRGPPQHGLLKICKSDDAPDKKLIRIPMGTYFDDQGPIENYSSGKAQMWLLTVVTTQSVQLKPGKKCTVARARIAPPGPPPAHPEMKPVMRFEKADRRYFEIGAPADADAPVPNLAPWNPDFPSLSATADSDFN